MGNELIKNYKRLINPNDETATHLLRTSKLAKEFGEYLKLSGMEVNKLVNGAKLHDVGKYKMAKEVLYKKGRLTEIEFCIMKQHVIKAKDVLNFDELDKDIADIILQHHERPDGKGYPLGLIGENINKLAKIFSLIDVFDALTSKRVYKDEIDIELVLNLISESLGTQFDSVYGVEFISFIEKGISNTKIETEYKFSR